MRTDIQELNRNRAAARTTAPSLLHSLASRLRVIGFAIPGIVLLALGLIPVFSSDRLPRSAFSFSCLLAGAVFLFADFKIFPQISGMKVLTPQFWNPQERAEGSQWHSYALLGSICFLVVTLVMISFSVLGNFYSARMQHNDLLRHGTIAQAKILKKCGNAIHGCLAIDYRGANSSLSTAMAEKHYQKSISVDQKFYQKLEDGDAITIVYPKGQPTAARFTEFDFSVWKPSVPRAWGLILIVLLTLSWFPAKLLIFRVRRSL